MYTKLLNIKKKILEKMNPQIKIKMNQIEYLITL